MKASEDYKTFLLHKKKSTTLMNSIDDITNKLSGLPTAEELKALYIQFEFDRKRLATHLGISCAELLRMKKRLLGNCVLPRSSSYIRHYNEVQWYTFHHAEWTHVHKAHTCIGNSSNPPETL